MSDAERLLEKIEEGIVKHGGDLGGWTRLHDELLQVFDGRVTLRAEVQQTDHSEAGSVHAHVFATLHEYDDEVLDACLFGMGDDLDGAISQAAVVWITAVAGPIRSFIDEKPICMTCKAGVPGGDSSDGYSSGDYGLPGLNAYVGPSIARGLEDATVETVIEDSKPWFRFAAEAAAPRRIHLAKATVVCRGNDGWERELEIDGHDVSYHDPNWPAGIKVSKFGYLTRFAIFEFPPGSQVISQRAELERTIRHFAQHYPQFDTADALMDDMVQRGFDADMVHDVESLSTIAFGRMLFEKHGVQYASTVIIAGCDGRITPDVPLMSLPAYSRARAIGPQLSQIMSQDDLQSLCLYNAESHAIVQSMEANEKQLDLSKLTLYPCVVPERGVSTETMNAALAMLENLINKSRKSHKPWWKFW